MHIQPKNIIRNKAIQVELLDLILSTMEIVISTDNNYVMPTGILMTSICENNRDEQIRFHILIDESVSVKSKKSLSRIADGYGMQIMYYLMDKSLFDGFPVGREGLPVSAYYRLCVAEILPQNINKVIYLDCDIIVMHSLRNLWNIDLNNYAIGCVTDVFNDDISKYNRLHYPKSYGYFNSGVLIINLNYWRESNAGKKFVEFVKQYPERILHSDQDVLNYVFREKKLNLPLNYNIQHGFLVEDHPLLSWEFDKEIKEAVKDPCIIHFEGNSKPWIKGCKHPFKNEFIKYKNMTEWANLPLKKKKIKFKSIIIAIFRKLGIINKPKHTSYKKF